MAHDYCPNAHVSRAFSLDELADALCARDPDGSGPAHALAAATLAPHVWACNALVSLAAGGASAAGGIHSLRLVAERTLREREKLQVWPDEDLLAIARIPYLALRNIQGGKEYVCHECGAQFEHPNPLKVHLYLGCGTPLATDFWRAVIGRLRDHYGRGACGEGDGGAARLEALATEWGRARGGTHLCVYCGKAYSRKYGLKIHIRTHTGYRPLRCRYCARAFGDPSNLNKHVRLHTQHAQRDQQARHACPVCAHVAPRRRDLQRHVRAHHAHHTVIQPHSTRTASSAKHERRVSITDSAK